MSVVPAAARAVVFGARVDEVEVLLHLEGARDGGEEARPAGARLEFHLGGEEGQAAAGADEYARSLFVVERAGARTLGIFFTQHAIGLRRQALTPLFLRQLERLGGRGHWGAGGKESLPVALHPLDVLGIPSV